ncbi:MAG: hypothetical protein E6Q97_33115 [Desulfurellales bacterium]|nr:MAG: hypothetical protein E6Q97_33115 [Desulfurellales bacterium]
MQRDEILKRAAELTMGDRNRAYGSPWENLTNCAGLWQAYFEGKYGGKIVDPMQFTISAEDVAMLNLVQKIARTFNVKVSMDTYIDMAAYSAIAGEVAAEDAIE